MKIDPVIIPQLIADYLAANYQTLAKGQTGLIHLAVCMTGGTLVIPKAKFIASMNDTKAESMADMETAVRRCIEAQDPKALAAKLRAEAAQIIARAEQLEQEGK